jgi:hypothetical protein
MVPHPTTVMRLLSRLDGDAFDAAVSAFLQARSTYLDAGKARWRAVAGPRLKAAAQQLLDDAHPVRRGGAAAPTAPGPPRGPGVPASCAASLGCGARQVPPSGGDDRKTKDAAAGPALGTGRCGQSVDGAEGQQESNGYGPQPPGGGAPRHRSTAPALASPTGVRSSAAAGADAVVPRPMTGRPPRAAAGRARRRTRRVPAA